MTLPNLSLQSTELTNLDLLYRIQDILAGYVIANYLLINQADNAVVITVVSPNLYSLAVQYYGDEDLWTVIASANNLIDPKPASNTGPYWTLIIPPAPSVNSGGVFTNPLFTPLAYDPFIPLI